MPRLTVDYPLIQNPCPELDPEAVLDALRDGLPGGTVTPAVEAHVREWCRLGPKVGIYPGVGIGQTLVETWNYGNGPGLGALAWKDPNRNNPGSIGIVSRGGGEADYDTGIGWPDATTAARAQVAHLLAYADLDGAPPGAREALAAYAHLNPRIPLIPAENRHSCRTVRDLGLERYAWDAQYGLKIANRANGLLGHVFDAPPPPTEEEPPVATRPKVLLTRGHGTTGDTGAIVGPHAEETYNRRIVPAIAKALRAAGYDVTTYPSDPAQDVPGTLDTEGWYARNWIASNPGEVVMIDCHLESSPARGIFAIVANDVGLGTGAAGAQPATDTYANNAGDRALGKAICEEISRLTGVPIRTAWVKEPGLMSEDMTYVGGQGWRLAMFGYTAEYHQRAYRLIVEFANLQNDAAFFTREDFPARCGEGVVLAMNRVFGVASEPGTPPAPKYAKPKPIAALAKLDASDRAGLDAVTLKEGGQFRVYRREVVATKNTPRYQVANARSKARVGPDIRRGERFVPAWAFTAEDGTDWYLSAAWTRILAADVVPVEDDDSARQTV